MNADFESKKKQVEQWLAQVIRAKSLLMDLANPFDIGVELCGCSAHSIHMYDGLEEVAFYLGATVKYNPNWDSERQRGYMSFDYKGFEVFQLWDIGMTGRKEGV